MMKTSLVINLLKGIFHLLRKIVLDAVFIYWRVLLIDQDHTGFLGGGKLRAKSSDKGSATE